MAESQQPSPPHYTTETNEGEDHVEQQQQPQRHEDEMNPFADMPPHEQSPAAAAASHDEDAHTASANAMENPWSPDTGANAATTTTPDATNTESPGAGTGAGVGTGTEPATATPPPPTTETVRPPDAPQRERESPVSPQLATLRAMFPDFDDTLLLSVLESVGNDQDRAVDALLGMSDPDYTSDTTTTTRRQAAPPMSQTELDEQFARQLMLQDQEQYDASRWQAQQPPQHAGNMPYETRQGQRQVPFSGQQQQQQQQQGPQRDTMGEFQDQFNKIAETGKRTFGSLFSKVKAKINELDQPRQPSSSANYSYNTQQQQQQQPSQPRPQSGQPPWAAEAAYYGHSNQPTAAYHPPVNAPGAAGNSDGGYDVTPSPTARSTATPPPPTTNAGAPTIDGSKFGMLPKRPVSLIQLNSGEAAAGQSQSHQSDDEELEYAESPFEERGRG